PGETYVVNIQPGVFEDPNGPQFKRLTTDAKWQFKTKPAMARNPDKITVAADGSGDFCTVQGAVDQVEPHRQKPVEIFIRKGVYNDMVRIQREKVRIHLLGEDRKQSVIQYSNNDKFNSGWIQRSVLGVEADDF